MFPYLRTVASRYQNMRGLRACVPSGESAAACRHIITSDVLCQLSYVGLCAKCLQIIIFPARAT